METQGNSKRYVFGEFELDEAKISLTAAGETVAVQRRAWDLLLYLVKHRDRVVDKDELQDAIWPGMVVTETALTRAIMKARRAVADDAQAPRWIKTVHGRGYHFVGEVVEHQGALAAVPAENETAGAEATVPGPASRRRRLIRILTAYGAGAWLLNQGAAVAWEAFEWDRTGQQLLLVLSLFGGLVVAGFAWYFVFTADGMKRPVETVLPAHGQLISRSTIGLLLVALSVSLYWNLRGAPEPAASAGVRVAVLPFSNLSADADFGYFADGVAVGLLQGLAQLPGVRVVGRTSSFRFRDSTEQPTDIAQMLGAEHLFEGSVQRAGGRVRVAAALLSAAGEQLWSASWDDNAANLFALQDTLAGAAVAALAEHAPGVDPQRASAARRGRALRGTDDLAAYDHLLRAEEQRVLRTRESLQAAVTHYEAAIAIDPHYGRAWSGLAWCAFSLANFGVGERAAGMAAARSAATRAAGFDPLLAEPHRVLAEIHSRYEWRFDRAADAIRIARELSDDIDVIGTHAGILSKMGRHQEAANLVAEAFRNDPLNVSLAASLTVRMLRADRVEDAERAFEDLLALRPNHGDRHWLRALIALAREDFEAALAAIAEDELEYLRLSVSAIALHGLGRDDESRAALDRLIETDGEGAAFQIAEAFAARGEAEAALEWLERAFEQRDPGVAEMLSTPSMRRLYGMPRFTALLQRLGLEVPSGGA